MAPYGVTPPVIEVANMRHGYKEIVDMVRIQGSEVSPRGQLTFEILNPTIVLHDPTDSLPWGVNRKSNSRVAAVDAVQRCGGFANPVMGNRASPHLAQFMDNGKYWGAYGKRIGEQAYYVVSKLNIDPSSRQAVITLWDPDLDNIRDKKDYPCTVGFQFLIRDDALHLISWMRSNDVWLGLAYDLFQFSQLQCTVANMLGIPVGTLTHRPTSLHLYERDVEAASHLTYPTEEAKLKFTGFRSTNHAYRIGHNEYEGSMTETEKWFHEILTKVMRDEG